MTGSQAVINATYADVLPSTDHTTACMCQSVQVSRCFESVTFYKWLTAWWRHWQGVFDGAEFAQFITSQYAYFYIT